MDNSLTDTVKNENEPYSKYYIGGFVFLALILIGATIAIILSNDDKQITNIGTGITGGVIASVTPPKTEPPKTEPPKTEPPKTEPIVKTISPAAIIKIESPTSPTVIVPNTPITPLTVITSVSSPPINVPNATKIKIEKRSSQYYDGHDSSFAVSEIVVTVLKDGIERNLTANDYLTAHTSRGGPLSMENLPNNAIDGNKNTFASTDIMEKQESGIMLYPVSLTFTFKELQFITKIVIYNRLDCCKDRLINAVVTIYGTNNGTGSEIIDTFPLGNAATYEQSYPYRINSIGSVKIV